MSSPRSQDLLHPRVQVLKDAGDLLEDEQDGALLHASAEVVGEHPVEVAGRCLCRKVLGVDAAIHVTDADTPVALSLPDRGRVIAKHVAAASADAAHCAYGKHDDQLVAGIGSLVGEASIVGRLSGLHVADHEAPPVPGTVPCRILELLHREVGRPVDRSSGFDGSSRISSLELEFSMKL